MKGFRFYLEHDSPKDKRKRNHNGNVIAIPQGPEYAWCQEKDGTWFTEAYGGVFSQPNSPCETTGASFDWLRTHCRRISEQEARKIHPKLFIYLEQPIP